MNNVVKNSLNVETAEKRPTNRRETADKPPRNRPET